MIWNNNNLFATLCPQKPDTHIMVNNFHKHRAISMPFDRIVRATVLDNFTIKIIHTAEYQLQLLPWQPVPLVQTKAYEE